MTEFIHWSDPPDLLELTDGQVHVWRANLDLDSDWLAELRTSLAPEEIERANRYVFDVDRLRFEAGRGILRRLLSKYLGCPPHVVEIRTNPSGKPHTDGDICFNLSHSGPLALYAFARNAGIGVDLERIRTDVECLEIAGQYFTEAEAAELKNAPTDRQTEAFFRCWTRKEACVKALGRGLSMSLGSFEVGLADGDIWRAVDFENGTWAVKSFVPQENCVGSIVTAGQGSQIHWWEFLA